MAVFSFLENLRIVADALPILLVVILELTMFELGLRLTKLFLLWRLVKLFLGADQRQFLVFLLAFVLQVTKDGVDIVTLADSGPVLLKHVDLLEEIGVHSILLPCLFELVLRCSEDINLLILLLCVQLCPSWFFLKYELLVTIISNNQSHSFEVIMLEDPESLKGYSAAVGLFLDEYCNMD